MTRMYNLEGSKSDRVRFDEVQQRSAVAMLESLREEEALAQDPVEYAGVGWEAFEIDMEAGAIGVDDLAEGKARFFAAFQEAVVEWQKEKMIDNFNEENRPQGETLTLVAVPASEYEGNWNNGRWVEVVVLDEASIVFRSCDDAHDDDWVLGDIVTAVDTVFEIREFVSAQNEAHQEMLAQQEIINEELERGLINA